MAVSFRRLLLLLCTTTITTICSGADDDGFCGQLRVYKQQWFQRNVSRLSTQTTVDLRQCLQLCCAIPNCGAVTFMGVTERLARDAPNCMFMGCGGGCAIQPKPVLTGGVVSVQLVRDNPPSPPPIIYQQEPSGGGISTSSSTSIWILVIAIVFAAVCIVLNVALLTAYACYRRRMRRRRATAHISSSSMTLPTAASKHTTTLQAFSAHLQ